MTIVDLLRQLGIDHRLTGHHHCTPGRVQVDCPVCSLNSGKFRAGIHLRRLSVSCWSCGGVSLVRVIRDSSRMTWSAAKSLVESLDGDYSQQVANTIVGTYTEPHGVVDLLPVHRRYIEKRKFDPDEIARVWGVRAIGNAPRRSWRLFIPCHTPDGKNASWTTRSLLDDGTRYVSADPTDERVPLKHTLYGAHLAHRSVIVVEGPTDAWRIGPGAVATYGTRYTETQVHQIARFPVRVICYDREPEEAQIQARHLAEELSALPGTTYLATLSGKDPDSSPSSEIAELRARFLS